MKITNRFAQGLLLVAAAFVIALGGNALAARERRLVLPGYYPNALRVPPRPVETPPQTIAPSTAPEPATTASVPPAAVPLPTTVATTTAASSTTTVAPPASSAPPRAATVATSSPAGTSKAVVPSPSSTPPPAPKENPAAVLSRFQPHPDKAYLEISGADAAALHAAQVLFLDARRTSVYEDGHIAGARPFSVWESDIDEKVNALFSDRSDQQSQNLPIVVYCSGGACEDSHMLAEKLWGIQFNNVYVYKDGFPDWQNRGGAVHTGARP